VWIFGYGSLIWRPGFAFSERLEGTVQGYARRFWQASTDHRGTTDFPGRVVTLVAMAGESCTGVCYRVDDTARDRVLGELAIREKGGYTVERLQVRCKTGGRTLRALSYIGHPGNPNFAGESPLQEIAEIVRHAAGPSGHNVAYVLELAEALLAMDAHDPHVMELAKLVIDPD
jgi:cation transport regulator ChaC